MGIELCGRTAVEGAETDTEKETVEDEPDDEEGEREHGKSDVSVSLSLSRRQRAMPNKDAQVTAADSQKTPAMPRWIARRSSVGASMRPYICCCCYVLKTRPTLQPHYTPFHFQLHL